MKHPDPFAVYRTALFVALSAYYLVTTAGAAWQVAVLLRGREPHKSLLRLYLSYQLLSVRLRPLRGELLQIAFWGTMLAVMYWLHELL